MVWFVGALAACGSATTHSADKRQIRAVERQYVVALAPSDYRRACSLFTKEAKAKWRDEGRRLTRRAICPDGIRGIFGRAYTSEDLTKAKLFEPRSIRITGDRAIALSGSSPAARVPFSKVGAKWLIDSAEYVDTYDAETVARAWAARHKRPAETLRRVHCSASGNYDKEIGDDVWDEFGCPVAFKPTGRAYVVYLRAVSKHTAVETVRVVPGTDHQLAPIP